MQLRTWSSALLCYAARHLDVQSVLSSSTLLSALALVCFHVSGELPPLNILVAEVTPQHTVPRAILACNMRYVYTRQQLKKTISKTFWIGTIERYIVTECSCSSFLTVTFSLQNRQWTTTPTPEIRLFTCNHKLMLQHQTIQQHHPPLFVSKLCEWMWVYFEYCALLLWVLWVEWTLSCQCCRQTLGLGQNEFRFYLHWM